MHDVLRQPQDNGQIVTAHHGGKLFFAGGVREERFHVVLDLLRRFLFLLGHDRLLLVHLVAFLVSAHVALLVDTSCYQSLDLMIWRGLCGDRHRSNRRTIHDAR